MDMFVAEHVQLESALADRVLCQMRDSSSPGVGMVWLVVEIDLGELQGHQALLPYVVTFRERFRCVEPNKIYSSE